MNDDDAIAGEALIPVSGAAVEVAAAAFYGGMWPHISEGARNVYRSDMRVVLCALQRAGYVLVPPVSGKVT